MFTFKSENFATLKQNRKYFWSESQTFDQKWFLTGTFNSFFFVSHALRFFGFPFISLQFFSLIKNYTVLPYLFFILATKIINLLVNFVFSQIN